MASVRDLKAAYAAESAPGRPAPEGELRKTLLAGAIGAVVGAVGYFIYSRLEDEQKEALRQSVGKFVEDKIADVRSQLKF